MNSTAKPLQLLFEPTKQTITKYYYNNLRADISIKNTHNTNKQTIAIPAFLRQAINYEIHKMLYTVTQLISAKGHAATRKRETGITLSAPSLLIRMGK